MIPHLFLIELYRIAIMMSDIGMAESGGCVSLVFFLWYIAFRHFEIA